MHSLKRKSLGLRRTLCTGKMANAKLIVPLVLCLVGFIIAVALILYSMFKKVRPCPPAPAPLAVFKVRH